MKIWKKALLAALVLATKLADHHTSEFVTSDGF